MQAITFVFAFVAVLALIGAAAWLVRRFAGNRLGANANRGRMPRLAVIDAAAVDGRRRLVLVRRDNVEHLLMIGGPTDIVVEPNIVRASPARDQMQQRANVGTNCRAFPSFLMPAPGQKATAASTIPNRSCPSCLRGRSVRHSPTKGAVRRRWRYRSGVPNHRSGAPIRWGVSIRRTGAPNPRGVRIPSPALPPSRCSVRNRASSNRRRGSRAANRR